MRMPFFSRGLSRRFPLAATLFALAPLAATAQSPDWSVIQTNLHSTGVVLAGPVLHFDLVRNDLSIAVNGQAVNSAEVGNGYVNWKLLSGTTYFTDGSIPCEESQVPAVVAALRQDQNIHVAAIVNHAALETPKILWVHYEAEGDAPTLSREVASALAAASNPQEGVTAVPQSASDIPAAYQATFASLNGTITLLNNTVYEIVVARPDESRYMLGNVPASASLGVGITFYVQPTSGSNAIVNSEFALKQPEVQLVIDALRNGGFTVPALHDHFIDDTLRLYYVHGFQVGNINTIGTTLYSSLSTIYKGVQ